MVVRSYRRVFRVDRRVYRVDRWALPVPGGVPLRGIGYFALAFVAVILLGALPVFRDLLDLLGGPIRYVVLPLALALLASQAAPDGREAHRFALAWLRLHARLPRRGITIGGRLPTCWDVDAARLHRARVQGPARVTLVAPARLSARGRGIVARAGGPEGQALVLGAGERLEVRP